MLEKQARTVWRRNLAGAKLEVERSATDTGVELLAIKQCASVVHGQLVAILCHWGVVVSTVRHENSRTNLGAAVALLGLEGGGDLELLLLPRVQ